MRTHSLSRPLPTEPALSPPSEREVLCHVCDNDLDPDRRAEYIAACRLGWLVVPKCADCAPDCSWCSWCSSRADVLTVEGEPLCVGCRGDAA